MKKVNLQIKFSDKFLYSFILAIAIVLAGVMVFAYGTTNPSIFGHGSGELEVNWGDVIGMPVDFADGIDDIGTTTETDPTVIASVKDGVSWSEISDIPSGFADNIDDAGGGIPNFCWYNRTWQDPGHQVTGSCTAACGPSACGPVSGTKTTYECGGTTGYAVISTTSCTVACTGGCGF